MKIFITGGTTGIGLELAKLYLDDGNYVAISGRDLSKLDSIFRDSYEKLSCYEVDVVNIDEMDRVINDFGKDGLDIVIANAGRSVGNKSKNIDFCAARDVININVIGVLNTFSPAINIMTEQGHGQLVAISSIAGFVGLPGAGIYSASKAAVLKFCESLSIDLKQQNINVTTIAPGFIDTPLTQKNNHEMPFIMSSKKGSILIKNAIGQKKIIYIFPWQMKCLMYVLEKMPRWLYRLLMSIRMFNYSRG